jgi:hypothetical protein
LRSQRKGPVSPSHRARDSARVCPWPGVTSARDRARAGSPTAWRVASLRYNPGCDADNRRTWTTSVQAMSRAESTRGRPRGLARRLVLLQTPDPERMFARFPRIIEYRLVRRGSTPGGATVRQASDGGRA